MSFDCDPIVISLETEKFHSKFKHKLYKTLKGIGFGRVQHETISIPYLGVENTHTIALETNEPSKQSSNNKHDENIFWGGYQPKQLSSCTHIALDFCLEFDYNFQEIYSVQFELKNENDAEGSGHFQANQTISLSIDLLNFRMDHSLYNTYKLRFEAVSVCYFLLPLFRNRIQKYVSPFSLIFFPIEFTIIRMEMMFVKMSVPKIDRRKKPIKIKSN